MAAKLYDEYTGLQRSLIDRLAEIEANDRDVCAGCGGEDCACCEIYIDRQKWVPADDLFNGGTEYDY